MDLSKEFIQYQIDNPHNMEFKNIVGYEDREDTIEGFKRLLNDKNERWIFIKDRAPGDNVEVLFKTKKGRKYVGKMSTYHHIDGNKSYSYFCITARGSTVTGLIPIAWMELPD